MKYKNNPFNIRQGSPWLGLERNVNGFCEFKSLSFGVRAALYLLTITYRKRGWKTIRSIIYHWAPPSDGNNTERYLKFVCSYANVKEDDIFVSLNWSIQKKILRAMWHMEQGSCLFFDDSLFDTVKNRL